MTDQEMRFLDSVAGRAMVAILTNPVASQAVQRDAERVEPHEFADHVAKVAYDFAFAMLDRKRIVMAGPRPPCFVGAPGSQPHRPPPIPVETTAGTNVPITPATSPLTSDLRRG